MVAEAVILMMGETFLEGSGVICNWLLVACD